MKIAVIADIHANLQALEAVMDDLEAQRPDRVVVNGDMVNRGPSNVAVLERLQAAGWPQTLGNHDDLMVKWVERAPDLPAGWFGDPFWRGTGWCAETLERSGWLAALRDLPMTLRIEAPGGPRLLFTHGSPRHYREGYGRYLSDHEFSEIVQMHPADVYVGSHTHQPLRRRWGRYRMFNSGAVGTPFNGDPRAQYLLIEVAGDVRRSEFRRVPYDRAAALAAFESSGFLAEGGLSARIFFEEARCARSFLVPFVMWTEREGFAQDEASWTRFRERYDDRFAAPDEAGLGAESVEIPEYRPPPEDDG